MRLIDHKPIGTTEHRQGWPVVYDKLRELSDPSSDVYLDDFVDATYTYDTSRRRSLEDDKPWVGILHHPATINSPLHVDHQFSFTALMRSPHLRKRAEKLVGAVVMCPVLAQAVSQRLGVPVACVKHPCDEVAKSWSADAFRERPTLYQLGFFLRDVRAIFKTMPYKYRRVRVAPFLPWQNDRDKQLHRLTRRQEMSTDDVEQVARMSNEEYDDALASGVALTHLYGAAANNVVVECVSRKTPIAVNRLPSVEYYLGRDYPLFYDDISEVSGLLRDQSRVIAASQWLAALDRSWLSSDEFVTTVAEFCEQVEVSV